MSTTTDPISKPPVDGFRGPQVCEIVGITYRQLDYWARTNLIRPSIADAKGSGSQRRYSYLDLVELKVIKSLLDGGVSLQAARHGVEYLRTKFGEDLASSTFVISGDRPILVTTDGELVDVVRQGQGVLNVLPLDRVVTELNSVIHRLHPTATASVGLGDLATPGLADTSAVAARAAQQTA
jgi:DNA-binding transcriptional MerR regulator